MIRSTSRCTSAHPITGKLLELNVVALSAGLVLELRGENYATLGVDYYEVGRSRTSRAQKQAIVIEDTPVVRESLPYHQLRSPHDLALDEERVLVVAIAKVRQGRKKDLLTVHENQNLLAADHAAGGTNSRSGSAQAHSSWFNPALAITLRLVNLNEQDAVALNGRFTVGMGRGRVTQGLPHE
jgi:hypothetical protein